MHFTLKKSKKTRLEKLKEKVAREKCGEGKKTWSALRRKEENCLSGLESHGNAPPGRENGVQGLRAWGAGGPVPPLGSPLPGCRRIPLFARDSRHKGGVRRGSCEAFFPRRHLFKKYLKIFKKSPAAPKPPENNPRGVLYRSPS